MDLRLFLAGGGDSAGDAFSRAVGSATQGIVEAPIAEVMLRSRAAGGAPKRLEA
jgi:hypothetical protein